MNQIVAQLGVGVREDGFVSVDDLGLNRGDGCFDATLVRIEQDGPKVDFIDLHLERLAASAALLEMPAPDLDEWRELIAEAVVAWGEQGGGEAILKLIYTRGQESNQSEPLAVLTITDYKGPREPTDAVLLSSGRSLHALNDAPWLLGGAKTLSYGTNQAYGREAARRGAKDPILITTDGYVLEGPKAGILVLRDGRLISTPPKEANILDSITVRTALKGWQNLGNEGGYELISVTDLLTADAAWLAASGRGIVPIKSVDGQEMSQDPLITKVLSDLVRP